MGFFEDRKKKKKERAESALRDRKRIELEVEEEFKEERLLDRDKLEKEYTVKTKIPAHSLVALEGVLEKNKSAIEAEDMGKALHVTSLLRESLSKCREYMINYDLFQPQVNPNYDIWDKTGNSTLYRADHFALQAIVESFSFSDLNSSIRGLVQHGSLDRIIAADENFITAFKSAIQLNLELVRVIVIDDFRTGVLIEKNAEFSIPMSEKIVKLKDSTLKYINEKYTQDKGKIGPEPPGYA